jgi:hypothetical protein
MGDDVLIDSETLFVINFVNLKIKPTQSFRGAHRDRVCARVFIKISIYMCISIYVYNMFFLNYIVYEIGGVILVC